jgi:hypothetical protein
MLWWHIAKRRERQNSPVRVAVYGEQGTTTGEIHHRGPAAFVALFDNDVLVAAVRRRQCHGTRPALGIVFHV